MSRSGAHQEPIAGPSTRIFTPARIIALALSAVLVFGLVYLRFAPDGESVSVPEAAKAGDLLLKPCSYSTEDGPYKADCGTLVVPENRTDPASRLIAVPVTRIRGRADHPAEPVFRLEGGPGITNMEFKFASRYAVDRDVVLVGYRGVDGSSRLECPEVESALKHSTDVLGEESFRAYAAGFRSCAQRLTGEGVDVSGYGLVQQADDLEAARVALGYERIDLVSESAGTRLAMIYAWRYPNSIHRSVMIGVNPPGHFMWDPQTTDEQIARYAKLCAQDESCRKRTDDLAASMRRTGADMPDHWFFLPIKDANVRIVSFWALFETTPKAAPATGPILIDTWVSAAEGDPSGLWFTSAYGDLFFPYMFVWGEYLAVGMADAQAARDYFASDAQEPSSSLAYTATAFIWGGGLGADVWPAPKEVGEYTRVQTSELETLLIGGDLDFSTPPQIAAKELLPNLPKGHQVVLPGFGHSASFWNDQPEAGTRMINTFFDSGQVDHSLYTPQGVDFTPAQTHTALAKTLAGVMIGLALLTVVSLLWMARWVHKRGRFGAAARATLRSVYPVVLGLGGWFFGALIVLTTMSGVSLDNALIATLSVGVPIGLGVYFAWVNGDWSAKTRTTGFAAAMAGALIGASLGFNATSGFLVIVTAIVGAAVGANLILLAIDTTWDRSDRSRFPAVGVPLASMQATQTHAVPEQQPATVDRSSVPTRQ
jgi:pimeloyl-ACP methyl ester carboxylesterase